jgi:hypothetical protein
MVNRTQIRVGYKVPDNHLYFGLDVMLMDFEVEMILMDVVVRRTRHLILNTLSFLIMDSCDNL